MKRSWFGNSAGTVMFAALLLVANGAQGALSLWYDASDITTLKDSGGLTPADGGFNGKVTTMLDKSGNANNAVAPAGAAPDYIAGGAPSGLSVLDFTGAVDWMQFTTVSNTNPGGMTVFLVTKSLGATRQGGGLGGYDSWLGNQVASPIIIDRSDFGGFAFGVGSVEARALGDPKVFHLTTSRIDKPSNQMLALYNNDPASYSSCINSAGPPCTANGNAQFEQIARYKTSSPAEIDADGLFAEVRIYDESLSLAAINSIGLELGQKWGFSVSQVPEPSTLVLAVGTLAVWPLQLCKRRRAD